MKRTAWILSVIASVAITACTVNPVTGERELGLISGQQEIEIGRENYLPTQQMQGGEYTLDPKLSNYVNTVGKKLAAVAGRDLPYEFVVLNNDVPNAWALPGGKIAVNRGLLTELDNEAELAAVLGHEITHAAARHTAHTMERAILLQLGVVAIGAAASDSDYANLAVGAGLIGAQIITARYSREAELEADYFGTQYMASAGYDPDAATTLQQTFLRLSEGREQNWLSGLFASHPPSQERVEKNRETAQTLPDSDYLGREQYRQTIAAILQKKPAYEAYNEGVKAIMNKDFDKAETMARQAIAIEPREAKFHALLGEADYARGRKPAALEKFNKAVSLNPEYFEFRIYRGLLLSEGNQLEKARADFEKANTLLPTAIAYESLGDIALRQGRRQEAIDHYSIAAQSDSAVGKRARQKLERLQRGG